MRLTRLGQIVVVIIAIGIAVGGWKFWHSYVPDGRVPVSEQGLLERPLRVGIVTWPGYAGGIFANNGFKPNKDSIYWKKHKLLVEFMLMEDTDVRAKAFASGGKDGVDVVWSTVDFWANESVGFLKDGLKAKAIMQVDWSRGGDAIVADDSIHKIEDLKNRRISLALFTPSHWLLEYNLENSSLDNTEQDKIVKNIVGKNASPDARADFVARKVDAAVVWEPDVTEALEKRLNSHILVSSQTAANLIADLMIAREDFINQHPDVIKAFVQGWLDGTEEASRKLDQVAKLLMENEPLYKDLGEQATRAGLSTVKWADLVDNTMMFGLDGSAPLFDDIFKQASNAWLRRSYISHSVAPSQVKDDRFLADIYASLPAESRPVAKQGVITVPKPTDNVRTAEAVVTKPVQIFFATGSADLDPTARNVLSDQVGLLAKAYSNAYIRVEGNTDNVGDPQTNRDLSDKRAKAVVDFFASSGFDSSRFVAVGNGPDNPVDSNATGKGRQRNRRTDIQIVPR
jgi:NitT/TauT family transport system substrate-binding protein